MNKPARRATWKVWYDMNQRCTNPKCASYKNYGARGIKVCAEWRESFDAFLRDMGYRPEGLTLDRLDNSDGYHKENCAWRTMKEQLRNTRRNTLLTLNGVTHCLAEWVEVTGIPRKQLSNRLRRGWSVERALTTPLGPPPTGGALNMKLVEYNGQSKTLKEWAAEYGIKYSTLHKRIRVYDWPMHNALNNERPSKKIKDNK